VGQQGDLGFYRKLFNDLCIYDLVDVMSDVLIDPRVLSYPAVLVLV